jgi:ABC-type uncharacterized transport system involved in gliding motility auxiliary subunit
VRRVTDGLGYAGLAVLVGAAALPFVRPEWTRYRWWVVGAGLALVLVSVLPRWSDVRAALAGRSARYGLHSALVVLIVLGISTLVQALSLQHNWRYDSTENKRYSLSPQTIQVLGALKGSVEAVGFFRTDEPRRRVAEDLFKQYARYGGGRFTWKMVDPDREPNLARRYGIEAYGTTVLEAKAKSEKVLDADEEKLTNGLLKVTRESKRVVYVVQGHGEHELTNSERPGFSEAKAAMEKANYEVKPLALAREGKIPADAALVILPGPRNELFPPEVEALDGYLGKGGKLFVMANPFQNEGLKTYVAKWGLTLGNDLIVEPNPIGRLFGIGPEVPIVQQYEAHAITRDLGGVSTLFPLTRSISAASPAPRDTSVTILARTSPDSWGETDRAGLQRGEAKPDGKDAKGPLGVAAVATRGKARLVLWGTSTLAANQFLNVQGNRDFFLNTVSWLAEEEDQISIRPKDTRQAPVFLTALQAQAAFVLPVLVLPGLVLAGGVVAVIRRRAAK